MLPAMVAGRLRLPAVVGLLTGALFVVFLVGLAPHLVHHLFDPHPTPADCPFATVADRQHAMPASAVTVVAAETSVPALPPTTPTLRVVALAAAPARAPPLTVS